MSTKKCILVIRALAGEKCKPVNFWDFKGSVLEETAASWASALKKENDRRA